MDIGDNVSGIVLDFHESSPIAIAGSERKDLLEKAKQEIQSLEERVSRP